MSIVPQQLVSGIARKFFRILSSKEFLAWLIGGWILLYVSSMIWTKESFAYFMGALQDNAFVQIPFVLFLVSGFLNLIIGSAHVFKADKMRFIAVTLFPLGIMLFLTGFFISATTRDLKWILIQAGDTIQPQWGSAAYRVESIDPGVRERFLDIDIESGRGFFKYEPKVTVRDRSSGTFEIGAFPPKRIGNTYYHILNFGLAPNISLSENGVLQAREYVPLRILGPDSVDTFEIQSLPYKFMLSLEPERTIQKGGMQAREFDINSPRYRVRVLEGEKVVAEEITKQSIRFHNLEMGFSDPGFWVMLEIVKDYGVLIILAGLLVAAAGMPLFIAGTLVMLFKKNVVTKDRM